MDASMETPVIARPAASMPPSEAGDSEHVDLALEGMTCAACAVRIEKVLNRLPGTQASVNFATESAGVRFDPARTGVDYVLEAVEKAGYAARVKKDAQSERVEVQARRDASLRALRRDCHCVAADAASRCTDARDACRWRACGLAAEMGATASLHAGPVLDRAAFLYRVMACDPRRGREHGRAGRALHDGRMGVSAAVTVAGRAEHVYFEASAAVITLVLLGKLLEARAKAGTSAALESLANLQPATAHVERSGFVVEVPLESVRAGDRFLVRAGDPVPVDGAVDSGTSTVDESMLTGESQPVVKQSGDKIFAGTVNHDGRLVAVAVGVGAQTLSPGSCASWPKRRGRRRRSSGSSIAFRPYYRAGRHRYRGHHVRRDMASDRRYDPRTRARRRRAGHRVPMRARTGDTDGAGRRDRTRRPTRDPDPKRDRP